MTEAADVDHSEPEVEIDWDPVPYKLRKPVELTVVDHRGEASTITVDQVTVRCPTGDDLLVTDEVKGDVAKAHRLMARLCGQPKAFARKVTAWDFAKISAIIGRFTPPEEDSDPTS